LRPSCLCAAVAAVALLLARPPGVRAAGGDPFDAEVAEAQRLYVAHDYLAAIAKLEVAYRKKPVARLLFNLGMAHRKVGHLAQALDLFERYRAARGAHDRDVPVDRYIEELRGELAQPRGAATTKEDGGGAAADGVASSAAADEGAAAAGEPTPTGRRASVRTMPAPGAPSPTSVAALDLSADAAMKRTATPDRHAGGEPKPGLLRRWWFWTAVAGAVIAGGSAFLLTRGDRSVTPFCPTVEPCVKVR
jgi:hypothetical protein